MTESEREAMTTALPERGVAPGRPRVEILIPVWGEAYIRNCLATAVASLLAPNNLAALARHCDVDLVFLTRRENADAILSDPIVVLAAKLAGCRCIFIDDLVGSNVYGVILTLAMSRAILRHGPDMTGIYFILMMSDFIIADGALAALAEPIVAGRSAIFAPSWRANEKEVLAEVSAFRESNGVLTVSPRDLAAIALRHPHVTVLAGMVEEGALTTTHYNQFYWPVDDQTMLSRQFLMHLICLRPEVEISSIDFFFDYGLFEKCCPSGDHVVLSDSDQYMALECQAAAWQSDRIRWGQADRKAIAADVASWTTQVHRRVSRYTCVLHSADLPPSVGKAMEVADRFISRLTAGLPPPLPASGHHYWRGAVAAWALQLRALGKTPPAEEFRIVDLEGPGHTLATLRRRLIDYVFGRSFDVSIWRPRWTDYRTLRRLMRELSAHNRSVALSSRSSAMYHALMGNDGSLSDFQNVPDDDKIDAVILDCEDNQVFDLPPLFAVAERSLRDGGEILIVGRRRLVPGDSSDVMLALARIALLSAPDRFKITGLEVCGSTLSNALLMLSSETVVAIRNAPTRIAQILGLCRLTGLALVVTVSNLMQLLGPVGSAPLDSARLIVIRLRCRRDKFNEDVRAA